MAGADKSEEPIAVDSMQNSAAFCMHGCLGCHDGMVPGLVGGGTAERDCGSVMKTEGMNRKLNSTQLSCFTHLYFPPHGDASILLVDSIQPHYTRVNSSTTASYSAAFVLKMVCCRIRPVFVAPLRNARRSHPALRRSRSRARAPLGASLHLARKFIALLAVVVFLGVRW